MLHNFIFNGSLVSNTKKFSDGGGVGNFKIQLDSWDYDLYEDSYEEGEGDHVNYFSEKVNKVFDSPKEFFDYLHNSVFYKDLKNEYYNAFEDGRIVTSLLVDEDNSAASESEIDAWRKGEKELYSANYNIYVSLVDKKTPTVEELAEILNIPKYVKGGKLNKYKYIPNRKVESVELSKGKGTVEVDGADVLNGMYVKKGKYSDGGALSSNDKKNISEFIKTIENEVQSKNPIKKPRELFFGDSEVKYKLEWKQDEQDENMYSLRLLRFNNEFKKYVEEDSMRDSMFIIYAKLEDYRDNFYKYANGGGIDSEGGKIVGKYKGYNIYDSGESSNKKYRYYMRDKNIYAPYKEAPIVANGNTIEMIKRDFDNQKFSNGGGLKHFVGKFNEAQLKSGEDKIAIEKAKKETGLKYIESKIIKKNGKPHLMEVYLTNLYSNGGGVAEGWTDDEMSDEKALYAGNKFVKGGGLKQKGKTDKAHDKVYKAKRVGYRYTDERAKKLGLSSNAKPTQEHIDKYLGNGVYKEDRANRSDKSRMKQI